MKIYTKHGDDGSTGLFGGKRVLKDDLRVAAYGSVDELNSALGLARCACDASELARLIDRIQPRLFDVGANLCTPPEAMNDHIPRVTEAQVEALEAAIDDLTSHLPPMKHFILPGGCEAAARLHIARTACRLAERHIVTLAQHETVDPVIVRYMNRLSDLLFVIARRANQLAGVDDVPWKPHEG
ncbi:MAG: cob(I)yrinic acid a,c-diamide adenosyltransferase [Planctomycetes bacterium]|nr:cob(I)yrinic acid a,c-diamide adenosyltransferase [Planctomycetota bacterium]